MLAPIIIEQEQQNHGHWINVLIPYHSADKMQATIMNEYGEVLKKVYVSEGKNSIDISAVKIEVISVKVETAYQTVVKEIKIK